MPPLFFFFFFFIPLDGFLQHLKKRPIKSNYLFDFQLMGKSPYTDDDIFFLTIHAIEIEKF